jgi:hypothetical protein
MSHSRKLLNVSSEVLHYEGQQRPTVDIRPWGDGRESFQCLREIRIGTIRISIFLYLVIGWESSARRRVDEVRTLLKTL